MICFILLFLQVRYEMACSFGPNPRNTKWCGVLVVNYKLMAPVKKQSSSSAFNAAMSRFNSVMEVVCLEVEV